MTTGIDPTLLPALKAIFERGPVVDPHITAFKRQCERDAQLRDELADRDEEAARAMGGQDYDTWSENQMGYHGSDRR